MMSCRLEDGGGMLEAVLIFKRDQLLYDIKNCAYIEGSVMGTDSAHGRHMVQDVGEEGNVDRVTRVLDLAAARCREALYPFTKRAIDEPALDDRLREADTYGIVLEVPEGFSQTTLTLLERLVHEYMVSKAVADWLSITYPAKAELWEAKAEGWMAELLGHLNARSGRVRVRIHPF